MSKTPIFDLFVSGRDFNFDRSFVNFALGNEDGHKILVKVEFRSDHNQSLLNYLSLIGELFPHIHCTFNGENIVQTISTSNFVGSSSVLQVTCTAINNISDEFEFWQPDSTIALELSAQTPCLIDNDFYRSFVISQVLRKVTTFRLNSVFGQIGPVASELLALSPYAY